ncbi:MAG: electron transfer flavoprotein subunit alpha/FixB family protein [Candidatus Zixiibacteriota bacterium]|nr:MAG: electron transfer flavoprotein subunit alpha/FixB family protein [candidate division Zixibacteria bacterium]
MKTLVVAFEKDGRIIPAVYEVIEAAKSLGGELLTAVLAADAEAVAADLAGRGGGKVLAVSNPALAHFNDESYAAALQELISKYKPSAVLSPATLYGKALMGRLAAILEGPMASDVTGLSVDGDKLVATRPSYGGSVVADVTAVSDDAPFFVTVRPKIYSESTEGAGEVIVEMVPDSCFETRARVTDVKVESGGSQNLAEADVIVSAGRGIKGTENVGVVRDLADALSGAFGASRAVVDAGWVPYASQVGQTGKTVNPKLYIAVGISGAIQHLVGMQSSQTIVAINKDKDAPIFNIANYSIVGDLFEIAPALTKKFKQELQN